MPALFHYVAGYVFPDRYTSLPVRYHLAASIPFVSLHRIHDRFLRAVQSAGEAADRNMPCLRYRGLYHGKQSYKHNHAHALDARRRARPPGAPCVCLRQAVRYTPECAAWYSRSYDSKNHRQTACLS